MKNLEVNLKTELTEAKKTYRKAVAAHDKMIELETDIVIAVLRRNKFFDIDGNRVLDPARDYKIEKYVSEAGAEINNFEEAFDKYCMLMHELRTRLGHDFPDHETTFTYKTWEEKRKAEDDIIEFAFKIDAINGSKIFQGQREMFDKMKRNSKTRKKMIELTLDLWL